MVVLWSHKEAILHTKVIEYLTYNQPSKIREVIRKFSVSKDYLFKVMSDDIEIIPNTKSIKLCQSVGVC